MGGRKAYLGVLLLLVCALLGDNNGGLVTSAKACPQYCLDVEYMTCPSTGEQQLSPKCNCCLAPKGCILHLSDGTSVTCS
ncbi:proteinase inhibitor PSI-1.2 [Punica granatum]|uniref:Proteinase inhibitor PSI-1.2 n=1 Tax=Punica granatum TaxID=22663 RepID=A0A218XK76_PUNGR|nr:proteinase inhibitor PSI-1.2 [Punica granatum]OWM85089.1 hypothetical protein CDL15_Pgr027876 [Punica granatum]